MGERVADDAIPPAPQLSRAPPDCEPQLLDSGFFRSPLSSHHQQLRSLLLLLSSRPMSGLMMDEEELIKARILTHEQRPYSRLLKRCNSLTSPDLVVSGDSAQRLREEIDLDFKFFESVITRIQLLKDTNRREVERYEKEKGDILETASTARSTLIALRESLTLSQQEKENKLIYDVIATDILSNRALKPRAEQHVNLDRLNKEIADLEAEREEYRTVWAARRAQFGQIVDQLEKMWAQIKEDKDEQDRREGMSEEEEGEEVENPPRSTTPFPPSSSGATPKPTHSLIDTTGPMDAATPNVSTPIPAITHTSPEHEMEEGEEAEVEEGGTQEGGLEGGADMEIVDAPVAVEEGKQSGEVRKEDEREEGEEEEGDKMDVT